ncbi:hypothetical protein ABK040_010304 [Willaertia magna]
MSNSNSPMNYNEKLALGNNIKRLGSEDLQRVVEILMKGKTVQIMTNEIEVDLDKLDPSILREIEQCVNSKLSQQ